MWHRMPTGAEAVREASVAEAHRSLVAIQCVGMLLTRRGTSAVDRELGDVIVRLIEVASPCSPPPRSC
jgi:hypothetical protein